jgi:tetratricopeptide (TPR) repeat protein
MPENLRLDELRRRVEADPTSIAFAALAEECRRIGRFEEAIEVCRKGLERHPAYLSARVTLGRALLELSQLEAAKEQLEYVLQIAPENLAAMRGLAEIHQRQHETAGAAGPTAPAASVAAVRALEAFLQAVVAERRRREAAPRTPPGRVTR